MENWDVVVIGAGAAGMMCAAEAGKRGRSVLIFDRAKAPGEKIRISGGGRCNFTNLYCSPANFISQNPPFCISALSRYTQRDFLTLVERHAITWHEKALGQLFCDGSATQIINLLLAEMKHHGVELRLNTTVEKIERHADGFSLRLANSLVLCKSLIVASGGKSIPKMGASGFGYGVAEQFGLRIIEPRPALVPFTFEPQMRARLSPLAGISVEARVSHGKTSFNEAILFTHRGLSGPAILQISSYWREGDAITISMLPTIDIYEVLRNARATNGRHTLQTALACFLPKRLAQLIAEEEQANGMLADVSNKRLAHINEAVNAWRITPSGSEGYRTAEVTLGGVDTRDLDSRTMQAKSVAGLYFIGEVVDVTGWLGGYNFQWAWSSGWAAGQTA